MVDHNPGGNDDQGKTLGWDLTVCCALLTPHLISYGFRAVVPSHCVPTASFLPHPHLPPPNSGFCFLLSALLYELPESPPPSCLSPLHPSARSILLQRGSSLQWFLVAVLSYGLASLPGVYSLSFSLSSCSSHLILYTASN